MLHYYVQDCKSNTKSCFRLYSRELKQTDSYNDYVITWSNSDDVSVWCDSRGDLSFHEDEDENQKSRQTAGEHHPDGEFTIWTQRTDDPATFVRTRHRETARNAQFLDKERRREWVTAKRKKMRIVCAVNLLQTWSQRSNIYTRLSGGIWVLPVCMCRLYCNPPGPWWGWQSVRQNLQ